MSGQSKKINKYDIHPDFLQMNARPSLSPFKLSISNFALSKMIKKIKVPEGLVEIKHKISGFQGARIDISILNPIEQSGLSPALVYFHGGAFAIKAAPHHKWLACEYALRTPCKVIFVDYRLAPKFAFPIGLEDCYSVYKWVYENAESLGINKGKIAVAGDSAGGNLTNGVSMLARDRDFPKPCFQMLIYPVLDQRQVTPSMKEYTDTPKWNSKLNAEMWKIYLKNGFPIKKDYASPAEAESVNELPPTYIEAAEFDCLRDEAIEYAKVLESSGIPTELHVIKRTVHGFEMVQENQIVSETIAVRIKSLQLALLDN